MINLTPHAITIINMYGDEITYQPYGTVARIEVEENLIAEFDGIPVIKRQYKNVIGLPEEGVPCLVSSMVLDAVKGRVNVFAPDTGSTAIRDDNGHIVAVKRLVSA